MSLSNEFLAPMDDDDGDVGGDARVIYGHYKMLYVVRLLAGSDEKAGCVAFTTYLVARTGVFRRAIEREPLTTRYYAPKHSTGDIFAVCSFAHMANEQAQRPKAGSPLPGLRPGPASGRLLERTSAPAIHPVRPDPSSLSWSTSRRRPFLRRVLSFSDLARFRRFPK